MQQTNHLPPERMSPEQRRCEVAALLALGLARLRVTPARPAATQFPEGEFGLGFTAHQRVHANPANNGVEP